MHRRCSLKARKSNRAFRRLYREFRTFNLVNSESVLIVLLTLATLFRGGSGQPSQGGGSEGTTRRDDESLSIDDLDGVAGGYVYDTGEPVEFIDNERNVEESFAYNKKSLTSRRLSAWMHTRVR